MKILGHHPGWIGSLTRATLAGAAAGFYWNAPGSRFAAGPVSAAVRYTCPMPPDVVSATPGDCPKCGMALVARPTAPVAAPPAESRGGCCGNAAEVSMLRSCPCLAAATHLTSGPVHPRP